MAIAMKDLEIRGAGNLLGGEQSGHIADVGFDLYVRLVGEAVAEFRGDEQPELNEVRIELPGRRPPAPRLHHSERLRLEMYRRLAEVRSDEDVDASTRRWTTATASRRSRCSRCSWSPASGPGRGPPASARSPSRARTSASRRSRCRSRGVVRLMRMYPEVDRQDPVRHDPGAATRRPPWSPADRSTASRCWSGRAASSTRCIDPPGSRPAGRGCFNGAREKPPRRASPVRSSPRRCPAAVLSGCSVAGTDFHPGVAARVGGTRVTTDEVDQLTTATCDAFGASSADDNQVVPLRYLKSGHRCRRLALGGGRAGSSVATTTSTPGDQYTREVSRPPSRRRRPPRRPGLGRRPAARAATTLVQRHRSARSVPRSPRPPRADGRRGRRPRGHAVQDQAQQRPGSRLRPATTRPTHAVTSDPQDDVEIIATGQGRRPLGRLRGQRRRRSRRPPSTEPDPADTMKLPRHPALRPLPAAVTPRTSTGRR